MHSPWQLSPARVAFTCWAGDTRNDSNHSWCRFMFWQIFECVQFDCLVYWQTSNEIRISFSKQMIRSLNRWTKQKTFRVHDQFLLSRSRMIQIYNRYTSRLHTNGIHMNTGTTHSHTLMYGQVWHWYHRHHTTARTREKNEAETEREQERIALWPHRQNVAASLIFYHFRCVQ